MQMNRKNFFCLTRINFLIAGCLMDDTALSASATNNFAMSRYGEKCFNQKILWRMKIKIAKVFSLWLFYFEFKITQVEGWLRRRSIASRKTLRSVGGNSISIYCELLAAASRSHIEWIFLFPSFDIKWASNCSTRGFKTSAKLWCRKSKR